MLEATLMKVKLGFVVPKSLAEGAPAQMQTKQPLKFQSFWVNLCAWGQPVWVLKQYEHNQRGMNTNEMKMQNRQDGKGMRKGKEKTEASKYKLIYGKVDGNSIRGITIAGNSAEWATATP